jgi:hypothetical protein
MKIHQLNFSTEYYQFYILDSQSEGKTDADDFWCSEANERRLAIGKGILGVTTSTYGQVFGEVHVLDKQPMKDLKADHIVEASMKFLSGKLEIKNCTGYETQLTINLEKDDYRIRISSYNLESLNDFIKFKIQVIKFVLK